MPVVGVIEPGVRSLVSATRNGRVGVIGTVGTIGSGAYQRAVAAPAPPSSSRCRRLPRLRRVRRAGRDRQRPGPRAGRAAAGAGARRRGRHPAARLHPLPVPRPYDQRRDGPGRRAGVLRRRDRLRGAPPCSPTWTWPGGPATATGEHRFLSSGDVGSFARLGQRLLGPELVDAEARGVGLSAHGPRLRRARYAAPGQRLQRLPRAHGDDDRAGSTSGRARWPTLQRHVDLVDVDAIVLTHEHPDHWLDLPVARNVVALRPRPRAACRSTARRGPSGWPRPFCDDDRPSPGRPDRRRRRSTIGGPGPALLPHRPPRRDARRARSRPASGVARLLGRHRPGLVADGLRRAASTSPCSRPRSTDATGPARSTSRPAGRGPGARRRRRPPGPHPPAARHRPRAVSGPRPRPPSAGRSRSPSPGPPARSAPCRTRRRDEHPEPRADGRLPRRAAARHLRAGLHRHAPPARCWSPSAAPGCCAPRRSTTTCPAGCGAAARAGSPPSTRCCRARRPSGSGGRSRTASRRAAPRRSSG